MKIIRASNKENRRNPVRGALALIIFAALCAWPGALKSQIIYSNDLNSDTGTNWVVLNGSLTPPTINRANFKYDYSKVGIPSAPHTTDGSTLGLQLLADINYPNQTLGSLTGAGLSASPTNFSISANFDMHVDMWCNYNGSVVAKTNLTTGGGGSGSSLFYGCGYGTAGTAAQIAGTADSIYVGTCTDNGSAAEYRMYGPSQTASYTDGAYQLTGTTNPAAGGDNLVYNSANGTRSFGNLAPWSTYFPSTKPPQAQINLYASQTNIQCIAGLIDFAWHDVEIQKIANVIVYSIDSHIVATANSVSAGNVAGSYLTFLAFDINGNSSTDPNFTNLNFVLFDNIRVFNYANVVSVQATQPNASEVGPTTGTFTITRSSAGVPLTVKYTLAGTATNGIQYHTLPGSITFAPSDTSTNLTVTPIDDGIPNVPTKVILTISASTNYVGTNSDTITIADGDTPTFDITCSVPQMYDRYSTDYSLFNVIRRGNLAPSLTVNLGYSGTAVAGVDYNPLSTVGMIFGRLTNTFTISPIPNPLATGNKSLIVNIAPGSGYAIGTASNNTATIIDSEYMPATLLLTNALSDPGDITNWQVVYGTGDPTNNSANFNADFGFDLGSAYGAAVAPSPNGASTALHLTCNKLNTPGAPGAVNAYLTNLVLNGNYAVRFNMNLIEGQNSLTNAAGEGAVFGINHSGTCSNWWYGGGTLAPQTWSSDGIWYFVSAQAGGTGSGDYQEFTGQGGTNGNAGWVRVSSAAASAFTKIFKSSPGPFTSIDTTLNSLGGIPANGSPATSVATNWVDVEIKQVNNVVTLSINHSLVLSCTNSTVWTNGFLMLGYADPYGATVETPDASVYYANLQVVQLHAPLIGSTIASGGHLILNFTSDDSTATFLLQSSTTLTGPYVDVSSATVSALGNGQYSVAAPQTGNQQFYRLRYK